MRGRAYSEIRPAIKPLGGAGKKPVCRFANETSAARGSLSRYAPPADDRAHPLATDFCDFVRRADFPCVGAKAALNRGGIRFVVGRDFTSAWDDLRILPSLHAIARDYRADPVPFQSLVVMWETGAPHDEQELRTGLVDAASSRSATRMTGSASMPDPRVAHDPEDPHFAMSFGGEAFFVVGLHPHASRPARRFIVPAMVFNLHDQFERLARRGPIRQAARDDPRARQRDRRLAQPDARRTWHDLAGAPV